MPLRVPRTAGMATRDLVERLTAQATGVVLKAPTAAGGMVSAVLEREDPPALLVVSAADPLPRTQGRREGPPRGGRARWTPPWHRTGSP